MPATPAAAQEATVIGMFLDGFRSGRWGCQALEIEVPDKEVVFVKLLGGIAAGW